MTESGELVPVAPEDRLNPEYRDLREARTGYFVYPKGSPADWMLGVQVSKTLPLEGRVSFWVFNAMDDVGTGFAPGVQPRFYASTRFGLELVLKPAALMGAR